MTHPLIPVRPQLSEERLRELREVLAKGGMGLAYVSEQELLYGNPDGSPDELLNPARWQPTAERLREIAEAFGKVAALPYVDARELLYGEYPEGNWDDIAADIPLSKRGFGT
jgi:hypothetical protein